MALPHAHACAPAAGRHGPRERAATVLRVRAVQVGFSKTVLSRGEFAEILTDNRPFTDAEQALFDESAEFSYRSFRDKAAASRGMEPEEMQELAQGRVWLGSDALSRKYGPTRASLRTRAAVLVPPLPRAWAKCPV